MNVGMVRQKQHPPNGDESGADKDQDVAAMGMLACSPASDGCGHPCECCHRHKAIAGERPPKREHLRPSHQFNEWKQNSCMARFFWFRHTHVECELREKVLASSRRT